KSPNTNTVKRQHNNTKVPTPLNDDVTTLYQQKDDATTLDTQKKVSNSVKKCENNNANIKKTYHEKKIQDTNKRKSQGTSKIAQKQNSMKQNTAKK
ncbi:18281_t:CDS:2, partial [Gigaspora margarita]